MLNFTYDALPYRVVFGIGCMAQLPAEVERLGAHKALVLCTPGQADVARQVIEALGDRAVGYYDKAAMHVPVETAVAAREEAKRRGADCCIAIGGGSATGLGKAIALESSLPIIALPTTYSGSEMTPIWGMTEGGVKKTGRDQRVLPRTVIYDPNLTLSLPADISAASGMNAIAHCVEALYAPDANPIISMMAEEGIRALALGLPRIVIQAHDLDARSRALYGAWLAGASLGAVQMGLHHKLCHALGGTFNLPHAQTHAVILPHAVAYNAHAAPAAMERVAGAFEASDAAQGVYDLIRRLGAPAALKQIGMKEEDLDVAAELATRYPYANPAPVTRDGIRRLLDDAYHGRRPLDDMQEAT
jgi:alcohol dehydrogenase class IV